MKNNDHQIHKQQSAHEQLQSQLQQQRQQFQHNLVRYTTKLQTSKNIANNNNGNTRSGTRRPLRHCHQKQQLLSLSLHGPKLTRSSEYKNLRQVVPSLRRQRDVGKVEVVTEAARYIDHLHKTLIERFVLSGIPDSLKGKLIWF